MAMQLHDTEKRLTDATPLQVFRSLMISHVHFYYVIYMICYRLNYTGQIIYS